MVLWKIILLALVILWLLLIITWIIIEFIRGNDVRFLERGKFNCDTFIIDGELYNYQYDGGVVHIDDSYKISKRKFDIALTSIETKHPAMPIWKRPKRSLKAEWATHNLLYRLGLWKSRTKDVDLDYYLTFPIEMAYWVAGSIAYIFIK